MSGRERAEWSEDAARAACSRASAARCASTMRAAAAAQPAPTNAIIASASHHRERVVEGVAPGTAELLPATGLRPGAIADRRAAQQAPKPGMPGDPAGSVRASRSRSMRASPAKQHARLGREDVDLIARLERQHVGRIGDRDVREDLPGGASTRTPRGSPRRVSARARPGLRPVPVAASHPAAPGRWRALTR